MARVKITKREIYPAYEITELPYFNCYAEIPDDVLQRIEKAMNEYKNCQKILCEYVKLDTEKDIWTCEVQA
jgi:hypothetical protein